MSLRSYGGRRKYLDRGRQRHQSNLERIEIVTRRLHYRPLALPEISCSVETALLARVMKNTETQRHRGQGVRPRGHSTIHRDQHEGLTPCPRCLCVSVFFPL